MNPVPAIRICLLLRQSRLKEFSDPAGFNRRWRIALDWESRQSRRRGDHVFQRGWHNDPVVLARTEAGQRSPGVVPSLGAELTFQPRASLSLAGYWALYQAC